MLGGARSGKSRYAESLVTALPPPWIYVATGQALDAEMAARIAAHKARRGAGWTTVEAPRELVGALAAHAQAPDPGRLFDALALQPHDGGRAGRCGARSARAGVGGGECADCLVANEVGSGIVPDNALARRFRDLQGVLNQRIAARADHVVLLVAGLPLVVKGRPTE